MRSVRMLRRSQNPTEPSRKHLHGGLSDESSTQQRLFFRSFQKCSDAITGNIGETVPEQMAAKLEIGDHHHA